MNESMERKRTNNNSIKKKDKNETTNQELVS